MYIVRCLFYSVLWSLHALEERAATGGGVSPEEIAELRGRLRAYETHCRDIVRSGLTNELKEEVCTPKPRFPWYRLRCP